MEYIQVLNISAAIINVVAFAIAGFQMLRKKQDSFPKIDSCVQTKLPEPGEIWSLARQDPFPAKYFCRIREIKGGWVRYAMGLNPILIAIYEDERKPIQDFIKLYQFHSKPE